MNGQNRIEADEAGLRNLLITDTKSCDVVLNFFGSEGNVFARLLRGVEFVLGRNDVLDLGAVFCFLDREGFDKDGGVWERQAETFEFGKSAVCISEASPKLWSLERHRVGEGQGRERGHNVQKN